MNRFFLNSIFGAMAFVILLLTICAYQIPTVSQKFIPLAPTPTLTPTPTPTIIPIITPKPDQTLIKLFQSGPGEECEATDFKTVLIPKTSTPLKDSINQLLKQLAIDYGQDYGDRVLDFKLISATIVNSEARLVFDDPGSFTSGGSCRINSIYSQIENTAKQFPSVKSVKITGAIFQP
jgi:hypothetical protein